MTKNTQSKIDQFETLIKKASALFHVRKECDLAYILSTDEQADDAIDLTVMAVTHGNELAGIAVVNRILEYLLNMPQTLNFKLALVLANTPASLAGVRFRERDLNRSFDFKGDCDSYEVKRAQQLEPLLKRSKLLIDLHQTIEASKSGFFIFPFSKGSFEFAHTLCPDLPIVTHWSGGFSKDGKCSDEFVNCHGGVGLTIELGHKGFDLYQESLGFNIIIRSFSIVKHGFTKIQDIKRNNIYSWAHVEKYPSGDVLLKEGFCNFQNVEKGEQVYTLDSTPQFFPIQGKLLFPKYVAKNSQRPKELYRIMKDVSMIEILELL